MEDKRYEVNMNFKAMRDYVLRTHYGSLSGKLAIFVALLALVQFVTTINKEVPKNNRVLLIGIIVIVVILNPLFLTLRAYNQVKTSPYYKKPITYIFNSKGIVISQGENNEELSWDKIKKVIKTKHIIAVYTSKLHAFVLPIEELGSDASKIAALIVQSTEEYNTRVGKNLKELRSGNGNKRIK